MIRPFTLITMILAGLSGAYLFAVKHRAQTLEDQVAKIAEATRGDAAATVVLQAEWARDIDPSRLKQLAAAFSPLRPMQASQLVTLAQLQAALPAPGSAPPPGENPAAPATAALPALVADNDDAQALAPSAAALPLPPPAAPAPAATVLAAPRVVVASAHAVARRAMRLASRSGATSVSHLARSEWAENLPPARPVDSPSPEPAAISANALPASASEASDNGGSMLGMAADLAPAQPLPTGIGN
jgi:hypothetical protein